MEGWLTKHEVENERECVGVFIILNAQKVAFNKLYIYFVTPNVQLHIYCQCIKVIVATESSSFNTTFSKPLNVWSSEALHNLLHCLWSSYLIKHLASVLSLTRPHSSCNTLHIASQVSIEK